MLANLPRLAFENNLISHGLTRSMCNDTKCLISMLFRNDVCVDQYERKWVERCSHGIGHEMLAWI